jgi:hypothetical protein
MPRFFLISLFLIAYPVTLMAQTAPQMRSPSTTKPLLTTEQPNKLNIQNKSIEQGMSEAHQSAELAHSVAITSMAKGVTSGAATIGGSRSENPAGRPSVQPSAVARTTRACVKCG